MLIWYKNNLQPAVDGRISMNVRVMHMCARAATQGARARRDIDNRAYGLDECVAREALNAAWKAPESYAPNLQARAST